MEAQPIWAYETRVSSRHLATRHCSCVHNIQVLGVVDPAIGLSISRSKYYKIIDRKFKFYIDINKHITYHKKEVQANKC